MSKQLFPKTIDMYAETLCCHQLLPLLHTHRTIIPQLYCPLQVKLDLSSSPRHFRVQIAFWSSYYSSHFAVIYTHMTIMPNITSHIPQTLQLPPTFTSVGYTHLYNNNSSTVLSSLSKAISPPLLVTSQSK